jgi:hypothetical protein
MEMIAEANGDATPQQLRNGKLLLSQPAEGGWHFYAKDSNPERAAALASTWSQLFVEQVRLETGIAEGPSSFIEATRTQVAQVPRDRSISLSTYLFVGAVAFLALSSFFVLFFSSPQPSRVDAPQSPGGEREKA